MIRKIIYLSHPDVKIDPQAPVSDWKLSDQGRRRLRAAIARGWPGRGWRIIASPDANAQETAEMIANAFALPLHTHPDMAEVDRSSTSSLAPEQHKTLAKALFQNPDIAPEGWESAQAAQTRIVKSFQEVVAEVSDNMLFVGHGAVGSFLWCALTKTPITRAADQTRCGSFWAGAYRSDGFVPDHAWRALETAAAK
jgi:broad specificity phosphatase PhoE